MAGSSSGSCMVIVTGARITRQPTYVPAHEKNGKTINAKFLGNVAVNYKRNGYERTDYHDIVAWGKTANLLALTCSKGKELTRIEGRLESYRGQVKKNTGQGKAGEVVLNDDGSKATTSRTSIRVDEFSLGADARSVIEEEMGRKDANGNPMRPLYWNRPDLDPKPEGQKDADIWKEKITARCALDYDGTSATFGFAKVIQPSVSDAAPAPALQQQVAAAANGGAVDAAFGQAQAMANGSKDTLF